MASFKVMTWNIESFFQPTAGASPAEADTYQRKLELLASVINQEAPDIVALQEVGGDGALQDLQQQLGGAYPHRIISTHPDARGIRVAFLSKQAIDMQEEFFNLAQGPALDIHDITDTGASTPITHMSRGAVHVHVDVNGIALDLITAHLKSKLLSFPRPNNKTSFAPRDEDERAQVAGIALLKREAEAVTLRLQINKLLGTNPPPNLIMLGDLNDVPDAQTTLIFSGPPGSEIGTRGFNTPDKGDPQRMFNVTLVLPPDQRYSRIDAGRKEMIDHILVSAGLLPVDNGQRRLPLVKSLVNFQGQLGSVTNDPNERVGKVAPDHAPVTASFTI
ncbi:MAG TPA: endonuclease/exonuclease/phosphatase family protein [Phototrophicaceae bacterium]|nr:endonuclease/exonuclease/phosphatase family protein [Phototrophicaceae bacterium]